MFNFFNKKKHKIFSPFDGECVPLDKVPDEAFSTKLLGDGVAIMPENNSLVAPADCTVEKVFDTKHAYIVKTLDGLEILIHIGIDTVGLNGIGFENKAVNGQKSPKGDLLSIVDFDYIKVQGLSICTPIIFTNFDNFKFDFKFGKVKAGVSEIVNYEKI